MNKNVLDGVGECTKFFCESLVEMNNDVVTAMTAQVAKIIPLAGKINLTEKDWHTLLGNEDYKNLVIKTYDKSCAVGKRVLEGALKMSSQTERLN